MAGTSKPLVGGSNPSRRKAFYMAIAVVESSLSEISRVAGLGLAEPPDGFVGAARAVESKACASILEKLLDVDREVVAFEPDHVAVNSDEVEGNGCLSVVLSPCLIKRGGAAVERRRDVRRSLDRRPE